MYSNIYMAFYLHWHVSHNITQLHFYITCIFCWTYLEWLPYTHYSLCSSYHYIAIEVISIMLPAFTCYSVFRRDLESSLFLAFDVSNLFFKFQVVAQLEKDVKTELVDCVRSKRLISTLKTMKMLLKQLGTWLSTAFQQHNSAYLQWPRRSFTIMWSNLNQLHTWGV